MNSENSFLLLLEEVKSDTVFLFTRDHKTQKNKYTRIKNKFHVLATCLIWSIIVWRSSGVIQVDSTGSIKNRFILSCQFLTGKC